MNGSSLASSAGMAAWVLGQSRSPFGIQLLLLDSVGNVTRQQDAQVGEGQTPRAR